MNVEGMRDDFLVHQVVVLSPEGETIAQATPLLHDHATALRVSGEKTAELERDPSPAVGGYEVVSLSVLEAGAEHEARTLGQRAEWARQTKKYILELTDSSMYPFLLPGQVYDIVVTHLSDQGGRSTAEGFCSYRGSDHRMCAVGVLIPDAVYRDWMEGLPADLLPTEGLLACAAPSVAKAIDGEAPLLVWLQEIHDNAEVSGGRFIRGLLSTELKEVADEFRLVDRGFADYLLLGEHRE
jgi:hypothetical protein